MSTIILIIIIAPVLLISVILHEVAHGLVASKLGDPTAKRLGRLTLNPLRHIDPMMTVAMPALLIALSSPIIFGGAKPVPVNPLNFKNPRRDMALVALAGPATNLLLAILCYACFQAILSLGTSNTPPSLVYVVLLGWMGQGVLINIILAIFNLIPVPPLDGGRIVVGLLPLHLAKSWAKLEPFGLLIVIGLLFSGVLDTILGPIFSFVLTHMQG